VTDLVYVSCHDVNYVAPDLDDDDDEGDDYPYPSLQSNGVVAAGCVPRAGDYFLSTDKSWWRVLRVTWSSYANARVPEGVRSQDWLAWVDLTVEFVTADPREFANMIDTAPPG
jgi:hypothetical protein